jgi:hypothetical protein
LPKPTHAVVHGATKEVSVVVSIAHLTPIVSIIAGILILVMPRLLTIVVALYLIFVGVMGLGIFR